MGDSNLFFYQGGELRPREGKAVGRPGPEQPLCCCAVSRPAKETLLLSPLS